MLHVILLVIKIIGIIMLSILGLLLLILLVCLFVPVIYRLKGSKHDGNMVGKAKVGWFFLAVEVGIDNQDKELAMEVRLFWISLKFFRRVARTINKGCQIIAVFLRRIGLLVKKEKVTVAKENGTDTNEAKKMPTDILSPKEDKKSQNNSVDIRSDYLKEKDTSKKGIWKRIKIILIKLWYFPRWVYERIRKIYLTIKEFYGKIKRWKEFFNRDTFKQALKHLLKNGNKLRKHVLPRKITGNITYGFDDPALTGQGLAVASMITPLYRGKFKVIPMFDKKILEGDIYMKGHVFGFTLLQIAWSVYRNKDVKAVIHEFSQKEA